jgi:hypothetical protein
MSTGIPTMHELSNLALTINGHSREKISAANRAIFEAHASFQEIDDPAAHLLFGMSAEQFELHKQLRARDIVKLSAISLPIWTQRFQLRSTHRRPDRAPALDTSHVLETLLRSYDNLDIQFR